MSQRIVISNRVLELQVLPDMGGSIARFDLLADNGPIPLLRGTDNDYTDVLNAACFPLVPFCNRIRNGHIVCDGHEIRLSPNMAGDVSPLHGQGWGGEWKLVDKDGSTLELVKCIPPGNGRGAMRLVSGWL